MELGPPGATARGMRDLMRYVLSALCVSFVFLQMRLARAAEVAFFPVETANLSPGDAIALGELFAQAYAAVARVSVLAPSRITAGAVPSVSYEDAARALGVGEFVRTSALAVGRRIVVVATRQRSDGSVIYQAKMLAESLEDLVPVSDRMAHALYQGLDDALVRTRHNVTLTEARPQNRRWREALFGVKSGLSLPFARDARFSSIVGVAFMLRLELERYFVEFGAGAMIPTRAEDFEGDYVAEGEPIEGKRGSTGGLAVEVGASWFLIPDDVGLYAGGGIIPKLMFANDAAGMSLYGQLGVTLPRDSSTRFSADLRFAQAVLPQHLKDGRAVFPSEPSLHLGVGW